jgi:hypothetical protein
MPEHAEPDLRQGAKAAAAAAAVGAAVGVARAIAARTGDGSHDHDDAPPEDASREQPDEVQPEDEQEDHIDDVPEQPPQPRHEEPREPPRGEGADRLRRVTETARELLQTLSGADVESVSALDRTDGGWRVTLEAVELRRIPDSTDVLATYEVELDGDGDLVRYERRRRYARSQSDRGDER